jgi:hypothetical protein
MIAQPICRDEILGRLAEAGDAVRGLGVKQLSLFGSWARNAGTPQSDIDILVEFRPGESSFSRFVELASLLESRLGRQVDLVTTEGLSRHIGPKIRAEAIDVLRAA